MDELLHARLVEFGRTQPEAPALRDGERELSYGQVEELTSRFAAALIERGLQRGDRVALLLGNSFAYPVACYGALRAGGVVVPLCPESRGEALRWTIEHSGARFLITQYRQARQLLRLEEDALQDVTIFVADRPEHSEEAPLFSFDKSIKDAARADEPELQASDLAAIHYTSGTTGRPKGVMLEHRQLRANVCSIVEYLELTPSDIAGLALPLYYVYGSSILHTHFGSGGCVALLSSLVYAERCLDDMESLGATGFSGVPATFARLVPLLEERPRELPALRYLTQAGAGMPPDLTRRVRSAFPTARLFVMYGQTEASARLAWLPPERLDEKLGSAGIAIPGVELSIIDEQGRELPRGEDGEVLARGPNIMRGYWRDPEESARALQHGGLRTGDLGHQDEDGFLWLIGRQSEIIKSGGHRIGPGEIEAALLRHPDIDECGVCGRPDEELGEAIVAFVVLREGAQPSEDELLRHALGELPRFKLPRELRFVHELPRTPSGKLQRRLLLQDD
jgi:long-chain acyl-CoA synthetase